MPNDMDYEMMEAEEGADEEEDTDTAALRNMLLAMRRTLGEERFKGFLSQCGVEGANMDEKTEKVKGIVDGQAD